VGVRRHNNKPSDVHDNGKWWPMRMWMVPPEMLCSRHLLGEHKEIHMLEGTILKGLSVDGYVENGLLEFKSLNSRHDRLVEEGKARGWKMGTDHLTPARYIDSDLVSEYVIESEVDVLQSIADLEVRPHKCQPHGSCKDRIVAWFRCHGDDELEDNIGRTMQ